MLSSYIPIILLGFPVSEFPFYPRYRKEDSGCDAKDHQSALKESNIVTDSCRTTLHGDYW